MNWLSKIATKLKLWLLAFALSLLTVTACSSVSPDPLRQQPGLQIKQLRLPAPPASLMQPPPPSGAFLSRVATWQRDSQATLSALPMPSAASSPTPEK